MQADCVDDATAEVTRSFLFVPADSERKLDKARSVGADALILDLEDSVERANRPMARALASEFIQDEIDADLWVRINALDSDDALPDLRAVMSSEPCGIVLPKPRRAQDANQLAKLLDVFEQESDSPLGQTAILPLVTETPESLFRLHEYADATARLAGLAWGAEDLSAAVGASANRNDKGAWLPPYELARSLCLFAAGAARVPAIDTVFTDFKNEKGLQDYASAARRDGFCGMLAIHPAQVSVINAAFLPTVEETDRARRIVALFENNTGTGVLALDGEMVDRPHWLQAKRILQIAARSK